MKESNYKPQFKGPSEVLQSLFENGHQSLSAQFLRWKLWMKWREVVGTSIADHSEPVAYYRGTLYVWVTSSAWMQQMHFLKDQIKATIEHKFHPTFVKNIRFTLDRRSVPQENVEDFKNQIEKIMPKNLDEDEV